METIINNIIDNFDWAYMFSVNILTYIIIKIIDYCNKDKQVSLPLKGLILLSSIIILAIIYKQYSEINNKILINSAILAPVVWDFIFKPIFKKLNLDYFSKNE